MLAFVNRGADWPYAGFRHSPRAQGGSDEIPISYKYCFGKKPHRENWLNLIR
jgi:hypothetical protein